MIENCNVRGIDKNYGVCYTIDMANKITPKTVDKYKAVEADLNEFYAFRNEEIRRLYGDGDNGWTYNDLAKRFGLTRQRIGKIVKENAHE